MLDLQRQQRHESDQQGFSGSTIPEAKWYPAGSGQTSSKEKQCAVLCVPSEYSQLPLVVPPEEGVWCSSHSKVTAPCVHQDIQLEKEER